MKPFAFSSCHCQERKYDKNRKKWSRRLQLSNTFTKGNLFDLVKATILSNVSADHL